MWVTTDAARLSPHSLHSNLFPDRPDVIKWHVAGDGCQEETESFIRLRFGGYRAFWSARCTPITLWGSKAQTLHQQPFYYVTDSESQCTVGINAINVLIKHPLFSGKCIKDRKAAPSNQGTLRRRYKGGSLTFSWKLLSNNHVTGFVLNMIPIYLLMKLMFTGML